MYKLFVLSLLVVSAVVSSGQKVRLFSTNGGMRSRPFPIHQYNSYPVNRLARLRSNYQLNNYINVPRGLSLNYPVAPQFGVPRYIPDGEYRTAHGIATFDGSDVSVDAY